MSEIIGIVAVMYMMSVGLAAAVLSVVTFIKYLATGLRPSAQLRRLVEVFVFILPILLLISDSDLQNDCCHESAVFSPEHRLSIYVLAIVCLVAILYSSYRKRMAPPLIEVMVNCCLLMGIVFDIATVLQEKAWPLWLVMNLPVALQIILVMIENHRLAMENLGEKDKEDEELLIAFCRKVLFMPGLKKFPLLLVLCLPVLGVLVGALLLFGQKPDSMIRAFTDTYHNGLSQLDDQCLSVKCPGDGHYLCTIAAKGHPGLVRPIRMGERAGKPIKCNRQLLVSNAFEQVLEERAPWLHRPVRRLYNKIGARIHRHYWVFDHAWVSDIIYVLMKPLEWGFVVVLYLSDRRPEDRIAGQYLKKEDRVRLKMWRGGESDGFEGAGMII